MDGGPYRPQQPADRRVASREDLTRRQAEEPRLETVESKPVRRDTTPTQVPKKEKSLKRFLLPIVAAALVIILGVVGWSAWSNIQNTDTAIDSDKYQAVFFTNGQVYFGKLVHFNDDYMQLTNIYYLQTQISGETDSENPQETSTDQNDVQLIKLGDEIHGPEDMMVISKEQVLFYENLKTDGKVAKSIEQYRIAN